MNKLMNTAMLALGVMLTSVSMSLAVQMSYFDDGAGTITQTYSMSGFEPGSPSVIPIVFSQFDDMGGTRTLLSVTVDVTQRAWGGYYAVDNDGATEATITSTYGATGNIRETTGYTYFLPTGSKTTLDTTETHSDIVLAANDGDAIDEYNSGGLDHYRIDGPIEANALVDTANDTTTSFLTFYVGTGDLSMDYTAQQSSDHVGEGALFYSGGPSSVSGEFTVVYTYETVPEPTTMAFMALACVALGLRRRKC